MLYMPVSWQQRCKVLLNALQRSTLAMNVFILSQSLTTSLISLITYLAAVLNNRYSRYNMHPLIKPNYIRVSKSTHI